MHSLLYSDSKMYLSIYNYKLMQWYHNIQIKLYLYFSYSINSTYNIVSLDNLFLSEYNLYIYIVLIFQFLTIINQVNKMNYIGTVYVMGTVLLVSIIRIRD